MKSDGGDKNESYCHRRVSVPANPNLTLPTRSKRSNNDFSGHMVAKSELWDTGNQHRCSKGHQKRVSVPQKEEHDDEGKYLFHFFIDYICLTFEENTAVTILTYVIFTS